MYRVYGARIVHPNARDMCLYRNGVRTYQR